MLNILNRTTKKPLLCEEAFIWWRAISGYRATNSADLKELALKITMEMNNKYHTPEEVRELFSELITRKVDKDCLILPPFYTEFGKNTKLGKRVFINTCCHFQDNGGIEIGDNSMLGSNVTIVTLNHEFAPEKRCNAMPKPVKIGKNVWIGANVTILPGVSIGDNSIIGAASVVTKDVPANTLAYGVPCRCIHKI